MNNKDLQYRHKYPKGMRNFVIKWLELGIYQKVEQRYHFDGPNYNINQDMRILYYIDLIRTLLNTEFQDQSIYKYVKDLPKEHIVLVVDCLSYYLGMNPHNGNVYLLEIMNKYPNSFMGIFEGGFVS